MPYHYTILTTHFPYIPYLCPVMQRNKKSDTSRASSRSGSYKSYRDKNSSAPAKENKNSKAPAKDKKFSNASSSDKKKSNSASSDKKGIGQASSSEKSFEKPVKSEPANKSKRANTKPNYGAFKDQPKYFVKRKPKAPKVVHNDDSVSVNKYISNSGYCSRREADVYIEEGRVTINDMEATKGNRVYPDDEVAVDGEILKRPAKTIYIAMNKPLGITSTTDMNDPDNIIKYIGYPQRIFPIGRLDKDSEGLILLTNDGDIVNKILRAGNHHEKEYLVHVDKPINHEIIQGMRNGVPMLGTTTLPCRVVQEGKNVFRIFLVQGLNRQIRRMCEHYNLNVLRLKRIKIMNISLGNLSTGSYRLLNRNEISELQEILDN